MSKNQYLQKRFQTWYVVVEVPKFLHKVVGKARLLKTLHTRDVNEANKLKHPYVAEFKQLLQMIADAPSQAEAKVLAKALELRQEYVLASPKVVTDYNTEPLETFSSREFVVDDIKDEAARIHRKYGNELANRFRNIAFADFTPIGQLPGQWLTEIAETITGQTKSQREEALAAFQQWLGDQCGIEDVTQRKAGEYVSKVLIPSGRAKRTLKRKVSDLSQFWQWLITRGLAETNPWRDQLRNFKKTPANRKGLTDDELIKLLTGTYTEHYQSALYDLIRLALATGARQDELCALRPVDVDRHEDGLWLSIPEGKTEAAKRKVPLHSAVEGIVERRLAEGGEYLISGLTPGGPDKTRNWYLSKAYARYREKVGVTGRWRDFHALRKTFAEVMEGEGVQESTVALLIGHARHSMTFGVYSKGARVNLREVINKLTYAPEVMRLLSEPPPTATNKFYTGQDDPR